MLVLLFHISFHLLGFGCDIDLMYPSTIFHFEDNRKLSDFFFTTSQSEQ
ncbi:hypothetical protein HMPREF9996_00740 [Aggregatibacter actinomycetemcomitans Y4]|nr:hypothetical protein HMPREF9996_00740 [Aggregatibacter actinomycetemcomitans Y4]